MKAGHPRIAIIGGGLSGVACAYELTRLGCANFLLYEASDRLGGIVETVSDQGFTIECGADSWVTEKPWASDLAVELGLGDQIIASNDARRRTYVVRDRKLLQIPDGMRMMVPTRWEPLMHSELLGWQARFAYLREPARAEELKDAALERRGSDADESVADFVRRHFGEDVTRELAGPLLSGVFGGDVEKLSVRAVMGPLVKMEAEHGSLIRALQLRSSSEPGPPRPVFTSLRAGLCELVGGMCRHIDLRCIRMRTRVDSLHRAGAEWVIKAADRSEERFDAVVLAVPVDAARDLLRGTHEYVAEQACPLLPAEASSAIVVALGFGAEKSRGMRIPRGFGFLVPPSETVDLLATTFVDQKFRHRAPAGQVLLRGFFGGASAERLRDREDAELVKETGRQLSLLLGRLPAADVCIVRRWPRSLPQYSVGHPARIAKLRALLCQLPGLHLIGNALDGVGIPDMIRGGRSAARAINAAFSNPVGAA